MWRNCSLLAAMIAFAGPTFADVVDVTISGYAGGSGRIDARCFTSPSCADTELFSMLDTNNNLDNFTASATTTAADRVTLSGSVEQNTDLSATGFSADLETLVTLDALDVEWGANVEISNIYYLDFTLTTASLAHLSEPLNVGSNTEELCFLDNADFSLYIALPCFDGRSFDQSFALGPGTYTLRLADQLNAGRFQFGPLGGPHDEVTDQLLLTADFTSIPEPRWSAEVPATLFAVILGCALIKRRTSPRTMPLN